MAVDGRRCNSDASYSWAAMAKVMAMLPPTMSAIATQNSMKIRRKRLCMSPGERVPRTAHVLDLGILTHLQIEFAAQIADVRVDAAIVSHELAAERLLGHRVARDHLPRGTHEQFEHAEFGAGERHRFVRDMHQVSSGIEGDRTDDELVGHSTPAQAVAGAPQDRANSRHQLARIEGLAEVVVRSQLDSHDPVNSIPARREHQDRSIVRLSQLAQDVEAADARQHRIENQNFKVV